MGNKYTIVVEDDNKQETFDVTGEWDTEIEAIEAAQSQLEFLDDPTAAIIIKRPDNTEFYYQGGMEIPSAGSAEEAFVTAQKEKTI